MKFFFAVVVKECLHFGNGRRVVFKESEFCVNSTEFKGCLSVVFVYICCTSGVICDGIVIVVIIVLLMIN